MASWRWLKSEPKLYELEDAYLSRFHNRKILPEEQGKVPSHARRAIMGCVYNSRGQKIEASVRQGGFGGDHVIACDPDHIDGSPRGVKTLTGKSLYLGYHMDHYGHFLTEFLPRLWPQVDFSSFDHILAYPFIFGRKVRGYHKALASRIVGFDLFSKLTITHGDLVCESLAIPESLIQINQAIHPAVARVFGLVSSEAAPEEAGSVSRWIFLSRSAQLRNQRVGNVAEVEAVFRQTGFDILYPEQMTMDEQLERYRGAEVIAGFSGSALHNIVFSSPNTVLIEVGDQRAPNGFLKTQDMLNCVSLAKAFKIPMRQSDDGNNVDLDQLKARLATILGSLERRAQA